ncbi:MAG: FmdB family transcriptional regulator [Actinobacteria bacterium]|nr:FmdB family transcriptional regulator [Actinomycetota bacterium]
MPTYEYKCLEKDHRFEVFQPITDDALDTCQECGAPATRLISRNVGISFKGSGFYVTDSNSTSSTSSAGSASSQNKTTTESSTAG